MFGRDPRLPLHIAFGIGGETISKSRHDYTCELNDLLKDMSCLSQLPGSLILLSRRYLHVCNTLCCNVLRSARDNIIYYIYIRMMFCTILKCSYYPLCPVFVVYFFRGKKHQQLENMPVHNNLK